MKDGDKWGYYTPNGRKMYVSHIIVLSYLNPNEETETWSLQTCGVQLWPFEDLKGYFESRHDLMV